LPKELEYVRPGMQLVENPEFVNARVFDAYIDSISERDRSIFAAVYEEIVRRGDVGTISKWYYFVH
jgi:hypothetical protein